MDAPEETLNPGTRLDGRYRLERRLGVGGHGTVWLAHDETGHHGRIAIKLLSSRLAESEDVRRRFRAEAVILRTLQHPGIVRAIDYSDRDRLYIVMEYLRGRSLAQEMVDRARRGGQYRIDEVVHRFGQVCDAVAAAHECGVVHRDLKPQNVFAVGAGTEVVTKVLDFGIAKILGRPGEDATTLGRMLGSYLYTSPEQVSSQPVDGRADVFALGCVLFEMLTLRRAWALATDGQAARVGDRSLRFEGDNAFLEILRRIVAGRRPVATDYRSDLPSEIDEVIARALEVHPHARFATIEDLRDAVYDVTRSVTPALVSVVDSPVDASVPRLPGLGSAMIADADMPPEHVRPDAIEEDPPDTRLLPGPTISPTRVLPFPAPSPTGWPWQILLLVLGGLVGAFGYHLVWGPGAARAPHAEGRSPSRTEVVTGGRASPVAEVRVRAVNVAPASPTPVERPSALPPKVPRRPLSPSRRRSRPAGAGGSEVPSKTVARVDFVDRWDALRREVGRLRSDPDLERLDTVGRSILRAARTLDDAAMAKRIERLAIASMTTGDVDGLAECVDLLERTR